MLNQLHSRVLTCLLLTTLLLAAVFKTTSAQEAGSVTVSAPDISAWPLVSTTFTAIDPSGAFIKDLRPGELRVLENNLTIPDYSLEMERVGVRFYVAINEGPTLDNRVSGVMRIERIKTALFNWIAAQPPQTRDEFHLVVNQGPYQMSPTEPDSWKDTIEGYLPDLPNTTPGMSSFSNAVDNALNTSLSSPKATAILFITPLPTETQLAGMQEIIARAKSNNLRVFIWLVGPQDYAGSETALQLEAFARDSGGQFFLFSGAEELPVISDLLEPMEYLYHLSYNTPANVSGEYSLVLNVERSEISLTSEPVSFTLAVSPPNPIFLSPPSEIPRSWTEAKKKADSVLTPDSAALEIVVEYPDGLMRDLVYSRLFVDDNLVDENTSPPFETFNWDISGYTETGSHTLQVYIEDVAGLKGQTIAMPVDVIVAEQTFNTMDRVLEQFTLVNTIVAAVILLVVIFGIILVVRMLKKKSAKKEKNKASDPVTQAVRINGEYTLAPERYKEKVKWPVIRGLGLAPARLLQKRSASPQVEYLLEIPLGNEETLIGSERKKVDYVLVHSTVSPLHARIFKDADGNYRIADSGSAAGTWVNYAPVSTRGVQLEHGDLVQFGRLAYIFEIHGAVPKRVQVLPYKED